MPLLRKRKFQPTLSGAIRRQKRRTLTKRVNKLTRLVKTAIETKNIDATDSGTVGTAGSVVLLNGIAQGDGASNRDGKNVSIRNLDLKMDYTVPSSTTITGGTHVRFIVFAAKDNDGTQAAVTDVLKAADWQENYNLDNKHNIRILRDRTLTFPNGNVYDVAGTPTTQSVRLYRRMNKTFKRGMKVRYSGTGVTVADVESNGLYLLMITNNNLATYDVNTRLSFNA